MDNDKKIEYVAMNESNVQEIELEYLTILYYIILTALVWAKTNPKTTRNY